MPFQIELDQNDAGGTLQRLFCKHKILLLFMTQHRYTDNELQVNTKSNEYDSRRNLCRELWKTNVNISQGKQCNTVVAIRGIILGGGYGLGTPSTTRISSSYRVEIDAAGQA